VSDRYPLDPRDEIRPCEWVRRDNPCPEHGPDCRGYVVGRWMKTGRHPAGETGIFILAADQRVIEVSKLESGRWHAEIDGCVLAQGGTEAEALLAAIDAAIVKSK